MKEKKLVISCYLTRNWKYCGSFWKNKYLDFTPENEIERINSLFRN